ncbi:MAG: M48 family metallopeptidase [Planctomycetota bacterium]|nr:M48 family metallopeptidase [Planctomycetota bacterium]
MSNTLSKVLVLALLVALAACQTTPITGKYAFNVFSEEEDCQMGTEAYGQFTAESTVITTNLGSDGQWKKTVEQVMADLAAVAEDQGFDYEVKLLDEDGTVNAWCLPCGKMAVYTGILPVCQDANGLAVVMGHEIGHAIARHGTQRMSTDSLAQTALELLGNDDYETAGALIYQYAAALPFGRAHELEADHIGLILMARAGYDPREAVNFWTRMDALGSGGSPEWLSTHPSHSSRIDQIQDLMPEALAIYESLQPK